MVLINQQVEKRQICQLDFQQADTEIRLFNYSGFIVLSNGCRIKAIKGIETFPIKERFGIDAWAKWLKLKDCLTQDQIEELWLNYKHDSDFVLSKEELGMFIF